MKHLVPPIVTFLLFAAVGCDSVVLDAPVGEPLPDDAIATLAGRWINDESEIIDVRRSKDGALTCGALTWDESRGVFQAETHRIDPRRIGSAVYLMQRDDSDGGFRFVRIESNGEDELTIHLPDPAKFRAAVENGTLRGEIVMKRSDRFTVRIRADSSTLKDILGSKDNSQWYLKDGLVTLRRIKRFDGNGAQPAK